MQRNSGETYIPEQNDNVGGTCPNQYLQQVRIHLRAGRQREALDLINQLLTYYPDDPVFLSYYGCLLVIVERMYRKGIETCQEAIKKFQARSLCSLYDDTILSSVFYYNLGRAYASMGKRNEARKVLNIGLAYDPGNDDILEELWNLGIRIVDPPITFLERSNPLNKYIGMILYKRKLVQDAKRRQQ